MKGLFKINRNKIKGLLQKKTMDFLIIWDSAYNKHQKLKKNPDAQVATHSNQIRMAANGSQASVFLKMFR